MKRIIMLSGVFLLTLLLIACTSGTGSSQAGLGDYVWLDSNRDGIQDPEEEGVEGVTVTLYDSQGAQVDTAITDVDGLYLFPNLRSGTYFLEFDPPADFLFSLQDVGVDDALDSDPDADTGRTAAFQYQPGQVDLDWDAGIYPRGSSPEPSPSPTPTSTPSIPPTPTSSSGITTGGSSSCTCTTQGVTFEVISYDNSAGWSDCGQASACHSIIGDQAVASGTIITSAGNACSMKVTCPSP